MLYSKHFFVTSTALFILLVFPFLTNAQSIQGYTKDAQTGEILTGVNVFIDGTTIGTTSDASGFYNLEITKLPLVLTFSYIGYETRKITIQQQSKKTLNIELTRVSSLLPEAVVRSKPKIDTIYKERYSVIDYEFFDKYILILIYRGIKKRYSVLLIDSDGNELFEKSLGSKVPVGFYKGCLGAIYFLTADAARQVYIQDEQIYFYKSVNLTLFEQSAYPCMISANDYVYFQNYYVRGQIIQYYRIHKDSIDGVKENFAFVIDEQRVVMAESEENFEKLMDNISEFVPKPGMGAQLSNADFMSRVVFAPIYAPIFQLQDSIIIFNHRFNQIEYYHTPEQLHKTVQIEYSQNKKWKKKIIRDEETQQFYTLIDTRWGYMVQHIDVQTGQTSDRIELDRAFVSNVKVKGGFLYFLENDFFKNDFISKLQKVRIE